MSSTFVCKQRSRRDQRHSALLRTADSQNQSSDHDRYHRSRSSSFRSPIARARASSIRSISKTARKNSSASARWLARTAPRSLSVVSTKTLSGPGLHARTQVAVAERSVRLAHQTIRHPRARISFSIRLCFPVPRAMRTTSVARSKQSRHSADQEKIPYVQDRAGNFERLVWSSAARAKSSTPFSCITAPKPVWTSPSSTPRNIERFASIPEMSVSSRKSFLFNTSPAMCPKSSAIPGRGAPADWREQSREQKVAVNQFHIAAVSEHFRGAARARKQAGGSAARSAAGELHYRRPKDGLVTT